MSKKNRRKYDESVEELVKDMPDMADDEFDSFMEEHGVKPVDDTEAEAPDDEGTPSVGEAEAEGGQPTQDDDGPTREGEDYSGKSVPYAALKEERMKRKAESEKAKQYETQVEVVRKQNEELQRQFMEMQKQLLETAQKNRQEQAPQPEPEPDPLRETVLNYVKPLIEPFQQEHQQREQQKQAMLQMQKTAMECEKKAREKYPDYDDRTKRIFDYAMNRAKQGDLSYAMDIMRNPDPAEYAYTLSFRLDATKPKDTAQAKPVADRTQDKIQAIANMPRAGMVQGGSGADDVSLELKMQKIQSGEMLWTDLTKEEQGKLLRGKF